MRACASAQSHQHLAFAARIHIEGTSMKAGAKMYASIAQLDSCICIFSFAISTFTENWPEFVIVTMAIKNVRLSQKVLASSWKTAVFSIFDQARLYPA